MTTAATTTGGATNHCRLSWRCPINIPMWRRTGHARGKSALKRGFFQGGRGGTSSQDSFFFQHTYILEEKVHSTRQKMFGGGGGGGWGCPVLRFLPNIYQALSHGGGVHWKKTTKTMIQGDIALAYLWPRPGQGFPPPTPFISTLPPSLF